MLRHGHARRALVAALSATVVSLALSATAGAATPSAQRVAADADGKAWAMWTAENVWKASPCGDAVTVTWAPLPTSLNAQASWLAVPGAAASTFQGCTITFNSELEWDLPLFCTVMVHEVGHLLGHGHSEDPTDIMSPFVNTAIPVCGAQTPIEAAATEQVAEQQTAAAPSSAAKPRTSPPSRRKATPRKKARKRTALRSRRAATVRRARVR